jgi:hypothetical protein
MNSHRRRFGSSWIKRATGRKQRAGGSSGTGGAAARRTRNAVPAMLPGIGSGLAALAILACAFGPMPDASTMIDASMREEGVRTSRNVIDNFLADSRQYLGL